MKMQKRQFRIGELAKTLQVEQFVIRFWEKEFDVTSFRSEGGQRFYTEKDLTRFKTIKQLLYEEGFTIAGAKKQLTTLSLAKLHVKNKAQESFVPASQELSFDKHALHAQYLSENTTQKLKIVRQKLMQLYKLL